jgi:cell division protein FtsW
MARLRTDWVLFLTIVVLVCFGLVMVYSASSMVATLKFHKDSHYFLLRQAGWALASFFMLMYCKRKNYRLLKSPMWAFGSLSVVLFFLVLVYFTDASSHRWLRLGPLSIQPSEFAKPALIVFLAWFVSWRQAVINAKNTLMPAALALSVVALSVVVADLGTALVLVATAAVVFFVAGMEIRYFGFAAGLCVLLSIGAVMAKPYRLNRVLSYIDPDYSIIGLVDTHGKLKAYANSSLSTRDASYQARQSKIAVGSGGVLGLGLMQGKQKLLYLPEAHTDFIYAVVGEELGLWGCSAVLFGFLVILWRGYRLFWIAPDDFGKFLALGITTSIVVQALINMSVVLDLGPTKGIPLPMISHGGSSLLSTLTSLGMLLSVSEHSG